MDPVLVFGPWSERYDLGPGHPLTPRRFGPGIDLVRAVTAAGGGGTIRELAPEPASDDELGWVHDRRYITVVRRLSEQPFGGWEAGLGPGDTPAFAGVHEAAAAVGGGSIRAMESILRGEAGHALHPGGGLHHAMPDRAAGFCVYNDPALAIARARRDGLRVLYVDLDVHHGDGVQLIHADDPGVVTLSIHQSGRTLFPGSGFVAEVGEGAAAGTTLNLPMDPGTGERGWLAALRAVLPEIAATFRPDVVVSQHGADAHAWDPLANLRVTTTAMGAAARLVHSIAHRWAGGRWLATGGGGYDTYRVVPRAWTLVWLAASHLEAPAAVPAAWRERWAAEAERYGQAPLPEWLDDEPNAGLRVDETQELADRQATETAGLLREIAVPSLVRAAADLGWWSALADLEPNRTESGPGAPGSPGPGDARPPAPADSRLEVLDAVDPATWARLRLADRVLPPGEPTAAHALLLAALRSPHAVRVTAAVAGGSVVGAAISAAPEGRRLLLGLGVAPDRRRHGLGASLLHRHVDSGAGGGAGPAGSAGAAEPWEVAITLAERDPVEPLARSTRALIARTLLEGAGFRVERAAGLVGAADPAAITAHRD